MLPSGGGHQLWSFGLLQSRLRQPFWRLHPRGSQNRGRSGHRINQPCWDQLRHSRSYAYSAGTVVTLAGTPSAGSMFSGWSSGGCAGTDPCSLAGNGSVTETASFALLPVYTLTVTKQGPGSVSSRPGGISCGSTCSASYVSGTVVTLTAVPGKSARFNGWSGGGAVARARAP